MNYYFVPDSPLPTGARSGNAGVASSVLRIEQLRDRYIEAVLTGDRLTALKVVTELAPSVGASNNQIYLQVIQDAQYEIGRRWATGEVSVAQEHLATAIAQFALANLYKQISPPSESAGKIIVTCVQGETHDIGARMVADFCEIEGFDVRYLGPDVPTDSLISMVREHQPDIVALSATMKYHVPAAQHTLRLLRESFSTELVLLAGGLAFSDHKEQLAKEGVVFCGANVDQLIREIREHMGRSPRS